MKTLLSKLFHNFVAQTHRARQASEGQSLVLIALMLVGILAMAGLIFDGGNAYVTRRNMQNAADSAAYAGAREFILRKDNSAATEQKILAAINNYAAQNGAPTTVTGFFVDQSNQQVGQQIGLNGGVPGGPVTKRMMGGNAFPDLAVNTATGIRVITSKDFPTFFLGVINQTIGNAGARATVQTGLAGPPEKGLLPIGVPRCYVDSDPFQRRALCGGGDQSKVEHEILGQIDQNPTGAPSKSYRGLLNFTSRLAGGSEVSTCSHDNNVNHTAVAWINAGGYKASDCGLVDYGQLIDGFTGNKEGNAITAMENNFPPGSVILVCVYPTGGITGPGNNALIPCIGFAAMRITGYGANSMSAIFNGRFIIYGPIDETAAPFTGQRLYAVQTSE